MSEDLQDKAKVYAMYEQIKRQFDRDFNDFKETLNLTEHELVIFYDLCIDKLCRASLIATFKSCSTHDVRKLYADIKVNERFEKEYFGNDTHI